MTHFKDWTKGQVLLGVIGVILLLLSIVAYSVISDYERVKDNTLTEMNQQIEIAQIQYVSEVESAQSRLDEQLLQSTNNNELTDDVAFRVAYIELQSVFYNVAYADSQAAFSDDALATYNSADIDEYSAITIYISDNELSSGTVYYVAEETHAFEYSYIDGVVTDLTPVGTYAMQNIIIEE